MSLDALPDRVLDTILFEPNTGHWFWLGALSRYGYGRVGVNGRQYPVHRYIYSQLVRPIPPGMYIDHICRVRHCVAPNHLRVVTPAQNTMENSLSVGAVRGAWTHCPKGHPFDDYNTTYQNRGRHRMCRACRNAYMRDLMRARTAKARQAATAPRAGAG